MTKLFQEKYRVKSARLFGWDYSADGYYFVTICTKNKKGFFGEVVNKKMVLSEIGKIVDEEWRKTEEICQNVKLDKWVVMPNHIHGILIIDNWNEGMCEEIAGAYSRDVARNVSTCVEVKNKFSKISPKPNSLPAIIRSFKSAVTKRVREIYSALDCLWQSRFYDRIIYNQKEYNNIQDYILTNVANWEKDEENLKINFCV